MSAKAKYLRWADAAARQYGIPPGVLKALISHESGWRPGVVSPAGAVGLGQFMPETARGLGINPRDPRQSIFGAAKYLRRQIDAFGGKLELGLAAYNAGPGAVKKHGGIPPFPETQRYVQNIMRDAGNYRSTGRPAAAPATPGTPGFTVETQNAPDLAGVAMTNLSRMSSQKGHFDPLEGLSNLVTAIAEAGSTTTRVPGTPAASPSAPEGGWQQYVRLAKGADRGDAHTQDPVKQFYGRLGAALGHPVTITTGTNHDRMTVNGNVSAHWDGFAGDAAMRGKALTRAGRQALILAGMDPKKARKVKGGLFNIGGYQIIFNTREGGNHWNHLHVGIRR